MLLWPICGRAVFVVYAFFIVWCESGRSTYISSESSRIGIETKRPLIGVLSQPGEPSLTGETYVPASYVKLIEMAGGLPVPIFSDASFSDLKYRFQSVNGLLIPGGNQYLRAGEQFYDAAAFLLDLAKEANSKGDYFPVHGTCLGFEFLAAYVAGTPHVLTRVDAENHPTQLNLTEEGKRSDFFKGFPAQLLQDLQEQPLALENHGNGLTWETFNETSELTSFFDILTTSKDKEGTLEISTMGAKEFPFTATQWHPEKNTFEWSDGLAIPHSQAAMAVTYAVGQYLVAAASKSNHTVGDKVEEDALLIYNYERVFSGKHRHAADRKFFLETFFFPESPTARSSSRVTAAL